MKVICKKCYLVHVSSFSTIRATVNYGYLRFIHNFFIYWKGLKVIYKSVLVNEFFFYCWQIFCYFHGMCVFHVSLSARLLEKS